MSQTRFTHWLCATGGVLVGGLIIKKFAFCHVQSTSQGINKFFKMWLCFGSGVGVTAISTICLKLLKISQFLNAFPRIAFIGSVIGMVKVYPNVNLNESSRRKQLKNILSCVGFWFMPSIYYCIFEYTTLECALLYSIYLLTICFTIGTLISLKNAYISDFGFKITISGACWLLFCVVSYIIIKPPSLIVNTGIIISLLGILIDDMQHMKFKYCYVDANDQTNTYFNPLRKSFTIFIESALIFGRLAVLIDIFTEDKNIPTKSNS